VKRFERCPLGRSLTCRTTTSATPGPAGSSPRCAGPGGKPVEYSGVTVLDLAPEAVARLRTYYDSAVFGTGSP